MELDSLFRDLQSPRTRTSNPGDPILEVTSTGNSLREKTYQRDQPKNASAPIGLAGWLVGDQGPLSDRGNQTICRHPYVKGRAGGRNNLFAQNPARLSRTRGPKTSTQVAWGLPYPFALCKFWPLPLPVCWASVSWFWTAVIHDALQLKGETQGSPEVDVNFGWLIVASNAPMGARSAGTNIVVLRQLFCACVCVLCVSLSASAHQTAPWRRCVQFI